MSGRKVLIIGVGFLGQKMIEVFERHGFEVFAADLSDGKRIKLDMTDQENVFRVFEEVKPEVAVLTAGMTHVDRCEEEPEACFKVNVDGTAHVVEACRRFNAKMVFISTDFVFDGGKGNYSEEDQPHPLGAYARSKVEGEKIAGELPGHLILRTSTLYGFNNAGDKSTFANWAINELKAGKKIRIVSDQKTCPALIDDVAEAAARLIEADKQGIYHCVGGEPISRHGFVKKLISVFGLDESLLEEIDSSQFEQKAKRPKDSSLSIAKLQALGIKMRNVLDGLEEMKKQRRQAGL